MPESSLPKVTIQLVTHNSTKYLPLFFKSVFDQTYRDWQVLVIDNNSQDRTVDWIKSNYPQVTVFQNKKNTGYAKAHNQGFKLLSSPYVLVANPDIILDTDWLEKIMAMAEDPAYQQTASFGGQLLKLKMINAEYGEVEKTTLIDSCGLKILPTHRFVEYKAGEQQDESTESYEVFGHSGALVLYKKEFLAATAIQTKYQDHEEYFDEQFVTYKEDIDLAWRLRLMGYGALTVPTAIAYHIRAMSGSQQSSARQIMKNRQRQSPLNRYYSYRNHFWLLMKNESWGSFQKTVWPTVWYELKKALYVILFEQGNSKAWWEVLKSRKAMKAKRREITLKKMVTDEQMLEWMRN